MIRYEFGDILLINAFPYSQMGPAKKRPALLIADIGDQDILAARITSGGKRDDYDLVLVRWKESGLILPSCIRTAKMATLSKGLILKKMGKLGSPDRKRVRTMLKQLFDL